ncbi:MAG: HEAT repeat domain-containing protein [Anaerolineae bacterium]
MATLFEIALTNLVDENQVVSSKTIAMLSSPNRSESDAFIKAWGTLPAERRRSVIAKMVEMSEERFDLDYAALYRICLNDPDAEVRRSAIEGLWEDEGWDVANILIRLMRTDPDQMVRASAATSLGRYVFMAECEELEPARAQRLRKALEEVIDNPKESPEVIRRAVEAIAYINDDRIIQIIESIYNQRDEAMKTSAVFAMGRNADSHWNNIVVEEMENASAAIRYEAARASGEMQLDRAVTRLINLVQDIDAEVQQMAIWALGQIGGKQAEAVLKKLSASTNEALSDAASEALDALEFDARPMDMIVHNVDSDLDIANQEFPVDEENDEVVTHKRHSHGLDDDIDEDDEDEEEDEGEEETEDDSDNDQDAEPLRLD